MDDVDIESKDDPFNNFGLMSPWEDQDNREVYINRHSSSLLAISLYLVIEGIIILLIISRYPMDNVTSTIMIFTVVWLLAGGLFMWYSWIHGHKNLSIGIAILFIVGNFLLIWFTLELRYQEFYVKYPNLNTF